MHTIYTSENSIHVYQTWTVSLAYIKLLIVMKLRIWIAMTITVYWVRDVHWTVQGLNVYGDQHGDKHVVFMQ